MMENTVGSCSPSSKRQVSRLRLVGGVVVDRRRAIRVGRCREGSLASEKLENEGTILKLRPQPLGSVLPHLDDQKTSERARPAVWLGPETIYPHCSPLQHFLNTLLRLLREPRNVPHQAFQGMLGWLAIIPEEVRRGLEPRSPVEHHDLFQGRPPHPGPS